MIPSAKSGGESFARPTRRSIDTASVMGFWLYFTGGGVSADVGAGT
jgi:hypothetical protein